MARVNAGEKVHRCAGSVPARRTFAFGGTVGRTRAPSPHPLRGRLSAICDSSALAPLPLRRVSAEAACGVPRFHAVPGMKIYVIGTFAQAK